MPDIRIVVAKKIITMNPNRPVATHVAIRGGRILGVGSLEDLEGWGEYTLDTDFADKVLMPGLVEGHSHSMDGAVWDYCYTGFFDRTDAAGKVWAGADSIDAVVVRLQEAERQMTDPEETLFAWGFDPIYFPGRRMVVSDLDMVSATRPILLLHSNGHLLNVNSEVMRRGGITRDVNIEGIIKDADGNPTGELAEFSAKYMAYKAVGNPFMNGLSPEALRRFGQMAVNTGVTTATDLHSPLDEPTRETLVSVTADPDFPIRVMPAFGAVNASIEEGLERVAGFAKHGHDKLFTGLVKIMTDGSIQGFSARMKWPGYYNGAPNGVWNLEPEVLTKQLRAYHDAGYLVHMHTNADEAIELMIDAVEAAQDGNPRRDHRHTLQHCQMASPAQFRRMKALGMCCNLFANHIYYWGEEHRAYTMGPDRAERMDACGTALREGVPFAIHSDAPVTPLGPLFTAWCAVNRLTRTGRVLGPEERISVDAALHAITLGAAFTLKKDHLVGSIEVGKFADFAVLEDDPTEVAPEELKDVRVWGTMLSGKPFEAAKG
ncbi:MAG: amidohydrolase [Minwuia sp.]|uniref:amidohydrolase n=1 Tax=Minwuia sp. TaxID=2493630 RepID=UPI003A88C402